MSKAGSVSKKLRFEIFKRDGFTCQYCGNKPPDVVLEVDHVDPLSNGGSGFEINLVTACFDCNRGKSDRKLSHIQPRPDADLKFLECQQEIAEANRFLASQKKLEILRAGLVMTIQDYWQDNIASGENVPADHVIIAWLQKYSPTEILEGIDLMVPAIRRQPWRFDSHFTRYIKYVSAIMRNRAAEGI